MKEIDYGKIFALHNAGWSNPKIADELQMSNDEYYNVLFEKLEQLDKQIHELEIKYEEYIALMLERRGRNN